MAMTAQRLAVTIDEPRWVDATRGCCQVLLEMRYVTPLLYTKTFKREFTAVATPAFQQSLRSRMKRRRSS
jgi:hypothetical protein